MTRPLCIVLACLIAAGCGSPDPESPSESAAAPPETGPPAPPQPLDFGAVQIGTAPDNPYSAEQVARGEFLVQMGDCNACHTPWNVDPATGLPLPDMTRFLSGHPRDVPPPATAPTDGILMGPTGTTWTFPFGTVYTLNLTPDIDTGTGTWTEEMFLDIFRKGRHLGGDGRAVLPPMPWPNIARLDEADIVAIFAYLRSIPPIVNAVPSSEVPPPVLDAVARYNEAILADLGAGSE